DLADEQSWRDRKGRRRRQQHLGLRLSLDGREGRDAGRADHGGRQDLRDALMQDQAPAIFIALEQSNFAAAIRQSTWLYPAANVGHIISLVFFAGAVAVMDVRLLGRLAATAPGPLLAR